METSCCIYVGSFSYNKIWLMSWRVSDNKQEKKE